MKIDETIIRVDLIPYLQLTMGKYDISTVVRLAHFLAQTSHESGDFKVKAENLNYSASGLANTWPKRFAMKAVDGSLIVGTPNDLANSIAHQPEKIANIVYSDRMGNGDVSTGDGFKYRGRGYIQLTGKDNYTAITSDSGIDFINQPDLLLQDEYAMMSAGFFWHTIKANNIADLGIDNSTVNLITRKINGGIVGLQDRIDRLNKIYNKLVILNS